MHTNDSRRTGFTTCKCKYFCLFIMLYQIMYMAQNVLLGNSRKYPYRTYHGPLPHFNPSPFPPCPQNSITVNHPPPPSTPPIYIFHFVLKLFGITGGVHKYAQFGLFCAKILVHSSTAGYRGMSHCDSRNSGMKILKK